jgi:hypothetical protein
MDLAGAMPKFRQMFRFTDISYKINDDELRKLFAILWYNAFTIYEHTENGTYAVIIRLVGVWGLGLGFKESCTRPKNFT